MHPISPELDVLTQHVANDKYNLKVLHFFLPVDSPVTVLTLNEYLAAIKCKTEFDYTVQNQETVLIFITKEYVCLHLNEK